MAGCTACGNVIHREELVSAAFTQEGETSFFHRNCEERAEHLSRWKEEAPWAFRPIRLTVTDWQKCSHRKHIGVWQSMFIARRDEDIWCPDCGLKISKQEGLSCPSCGAHVIVTGIETTNMLFTHREHLFKLLLHCSEKGEDTTTYAIVSGFTPVTITAREKEKRESKRGNAMMLEYQPKGDPKQGLKV